MHVLYGSSSGLTAAGSQMWTEKSPGVRGEAESGDLFGSALAAGNFGRGDYDDLAIGVIYDYLSGRMSAGSVTVMYGSRAGLTASGSQRWTQNSRGIPGTVEDEEYFGQALTAARFTGSRYDDLAIGVPGENNYTGAVNVIYGSSRGLTRRNAQILSQATRGVAGKAESGDVFGVALVGGVFGRDRNGSYDDLAIGVPGESLGRVHNAGLCRLSTDQSGVSTQRRPDNPSRTTRDPRCGGTLETNSDGSWPAAASTVALAWTSPSDRRASSPSTCCTAHPAVSGPTAINCGRSVALFFQANSIGRRQALMMVGDCRRGPARSER